MAMGTGGLDPSAPPASASPAEHWWQVQCRVPCQGHAPNETSWSFPHRIPLELPLSAGDGVGSRGSLPADPPALLLDQYSRHPKHFVITAIYLHPKKVLLRVGSDLRLRCSVCVCSLGNTGFIGCARPRVLALAVPARPFPELLGCAVPSLGLGSPPGHPDLVCAVGKGSLSLLPPLGSREGQGEPSGTCRGKVGCAGGEKGNETLSPVQPDNEKLPEAPPTFLSSRHRSL